MESVFSNLDTTVYKYEKIVFINNGKKQKYTEKENT